MTLDRLQEMLAPVRDSPLLPLWLLLAFLVAGLLFLPVWLMIVTTSLWLDPPLSFAVALAGALLSSSTFFAVGRLARAPLTRRFGNRRAFLAMRGAGLEHIVALRVVPVLPFTLVNMSAGALGVPFRTFFAGTVLGMAPFIFAVTFLGDRARKAFTDPTPASMAVLAGAAVVLVGVAAAMRKLVARRSKDPASATPEGLP